MQTQVGNGLVRWAGYSILAPLVASALLSFWHTVITGAAALTANLVIYGFMIDGISAGGPLRHGLTGGTRLCHQSGRLLDPAGPDEAGSNAS